MSAANWITEAKEALEYAATLAAKSFWPRDAEDFRALAARAPVDAVVLSPDELLDFGDWFIRCVA